MVLGLWLQLAGATLLIVGGAHYLTRSADIIAVRTGLGHSFIGVILLATATSLPELGTGVSAIALYDATDLAMGAAFGSNLFNLLIITLLDMSWRRGPILSAVSGTALLVAGLGILIIALGSAAVLLHHENLLPGSWRLSPASFVVLGVFLAAMYLVYRHEHPAGNKRVSRPKRAGNGMSLAQACWRFVAAAAVVIGGAIWLSRTGDLLVQKLGWEASFVGTQFLALCTSLPEVATSFAALRMGALDLAITNVLGSNLFNMGFVLFANDAVYGNGAIWSDISQIHAFTGGIAIIMTSVVIIGLMKKPARDPSRPARSYGTFETFMLIALYVAASVTVFYAG
ncbi:MAG: sodium:calcium antiporter [Candidatus Krumholzibacteriia bacterium]